MADNQEIVLFKSGVHNLLPEEVIPQDAATDEKNWLSQDGRLLLVPGKLLIGAAGVAGSVTGEIFGYRTDGIKVHWRKIGAKIQYDAGTAAVPNWVDVITGLTAAADYSFANYSSLAGAFTFAIGVDGIFKMNNANPASYIALYNASKNFKGLAIIDKGRMILWNRPEDKTGFYGSKIDPQNSTVYTTVTGEATASLGGTLAFKAGGATRNAFGIQITLTGTGEVYTDKFNGILVGSLGGTGTINYITGAYTLSNAGAGLANYQWEDSNVGGITDFTKSATRLAGEGFVFPQDEGGDPIMQVLIGPDAAYYSLKQQSAYRLSIDADDKGADNDVYRKNIGVASYRGAVSTGAGIIFMNVANPEKPEMTILEKNLVGDSVIPRVLFPQFKFANYAYDDCTFDTFDRYVIVACKSAGVSNNDTLLLTNVTAKTVDITNYSGRTFANDQGKMYMGSSIVQSVFLLFSGFDDDGFTIDNYWVGKGELFGTEDLKKYRKIRLKGGISINQSYEVYESFDDAGFQLVGTVLGSGSYVDYNSPQTIGSNVVGTSQVGGDTLSDVYPYFLEIRLKKVPKFRKHKLKFVALGYGYASIELLNAIDVSVYEGKIPARYRQKQNVSLNGQTVDNAHPEF